MKKEYENQNEALMKALAEPSLLLKDFTRLGYEPSFQSYCRCFLPVYLSAVREAGADGMPALTDSLLDGIEKQWKNVRFWNRSLARSEIKQVVVGYLTPMLLSEPELRPLAASLRDGWNRRWPEDTYHAAGYDTIRRGFKLRVLGFEIPEKKKEELPQDEI